MQTIYRNYRISTETRGMFGLFEIYQSSYQPVPNARGSYTPIRTTQSPNKFEAAGYVMADGTGYPLEALAQERAKELIDANLETTALHMIRSSPRY